MCKRVNRIMLRVRSLSQVSEPRSRVQSAGRYGNLEAKPSRKKLRGFVIKKKKKKHLDIILHVFQGHLKQPNLCLETN